MARNFDDWRQLDLLQKACALAFAVEGLLAPLVTDSDYVRAAKYCVLLSADPWPAACEKFRRQMLAAFVDLVRDALIHEPMRLGSHDDLAEELVLITIRNAGDWWSRRAQSTNGSWVGFPYRHIRTLSERRSQWIWSGGTEEDWMDYEDVGKPTSDLAKGPDFERRRQAVRAAIRRLSRKEQRAVRLTSGFFPARQAWKIADIAFYLQMSERDCMKLLKVAIAKLRGLLG